jgi:hypothetical protein
MSNEQEGAPFEYFVNLLKRDFFNFAQQERVKDVPKQKRSSTKTTEKSSTSFGRHVEWNPQNYVMLKAGIPFQVKSDLDAIETKTEDLFYIFRNKDPNVQRNVNIPRFEAAYFCEQEGKYYRVQKSHLKEAYAHEQKIDRTQIWDVDPKTNLPYWVDRFAFTNVAKAKQQKHLGGRKKAKSAPAEEQQNSN